MRGFVDRVLAQRRRALLGGCLAGVIGLAGVAPAQAADGYVVAYPSGCDYFIVETRSGYALLEWYGGYDPSEGQRVVGAFESYGFKTVHNISADRETRVWVEDYWLSESEVVEQYHEQCD